MKLITPRQTTRLRKDRLRKLANFLENKVKPLWFNIEHFTSEGFPKRECGSSACAIGWTPAAFPKSGFGMNKFGEVLYKRKSGFSAARLFYGLDIKESHWLFVGASYPFGKRGRMAVVRRIRRFVKDPSICLRG